MSNGKSILDFLQDTLGTFNGGNSNVIKKSDLRECLQQNAEYCKIVATNLEKFKPEEWRAWRNEIINQKLKSLDKKLVGLYTNYADALSGKAAQDEKSYMLRSLLVVNKFFADVLDKASRDLDKIIPDDKLSVFDTRLSVIGILGLINMSNIVANHTTFLFSFICAVGSDHLPTYPRYQLKYLDKYGAKVGVIVNKVYAANLKFDYLQDIETMRRRFEDIRLSTDGISFKDLKMVTNKVFTDKNELLSKLRDFGTGLWGATYTGTIAKLLALVIFYAIPMVGMFFHKAANITTVLDDWRYNRNLKNKEMAEWLRNRISLNRMILNEIDPTSAEYNRQESIVKSYEAKLQSYDEKIMAFEEEYANVD